MTNADETGWDDVSLAGRRVLPKVLRALFYLTVLVVLVPFGAANTLPFAIASTLAGLVTAAMLLAFGAPAKTRAHFVAALLIVLLLVAWGIVQTVPLGHWANAVWSDLGSDFAAGTISVTPADTRYALLRLALPFVLFLGALAAFGDDTSAERLLRFIGLSGAVVAVWSIFQFAVLPDTLLIGDKTYYLDSLTGVFVNRNTAATYFGLVSITLVSLASTRDGRGTWSALAFSSYTGGRRRARADRMYFVYLGGAAIALTALFLTRSRAGVGAAFLAYLVLVPILVSIPKRETEASPFRMRRRSNLVGTALRVFGGIVLVASVGLVYADRVLSRVEIQGTDDARFCVAPAVIRAAIDNWRTGVGFGSFLDFFPAYRNAACGIDRVWDKAHSVYLEGFLGLGIVFWVVLVIAVVMLMATFVGGIRHRRSWRGGPAAGLAVLVLTLAHSAVDFSLQIPGFAAVFAVTMAATVTIAVGRNVRGGRGW